MKRGAGVVAIEDKKVLLVRAGIASKQIEGTVSFPGGRVEEGETELETAKREFTEETGLTSDKLIDFPGNYVETIVSTKTGDLEISFKVYLVTEFNGNLRTTQETEPFWTDIDEARKMSLYGKNNQILEDAIKFLES